MSIYEAAKKDLLQVRKFILEEGRELIYDNKEISAEYNILQQPDGKAFLIHLNENDETIIVRELDSDEYKLLDDYTNL
ncbi:hypothetical protein IO424_001778 [Campylobacter fetus]|uniref:hypothetical protein n=1 Tax=Campylobacter fetus TaxID=196 RepID=UPI000508F12C|nr:hypothetical protein [Campylobacter fetus]AIR78572.1 hypothetical protein CFF04554_0654 [Campylobacter fetus subsp. fetus 04/554]EAJ5693215.1 hypothetical protein [Campylobacter fetus]EAJ5705247.1 hypothetical protein [Campylobacter fetus]EAJ9257427.1 hypothetical protein [Campylobacter fetus]EAK0814783.1 hypothetical protein [Campylobacter fetus]